MDKIDPLIVFLERISNGDVELSQPVKILVKGQK